MPGKKKKKKGTGWKHPKTGEWWSSKRGYHKYWKKYLQPKSKKQQLEEERTYKLEIIESHYWELYAELTGLKKAERNKMLDEITMEEIEPVSEYEYIPDY